MRFSVDQLEAALDDALETSNSRLIWQIVEELERRGQVLEV
jgi:hypothetical protein